MCMLLVHYMFLESRYYVAKIAIFFMHGGTLALYSSLDTTWYQENALWSVWKVHQLNPHFPGILPEDAWKDPNGMRDFLRAKNIHVSSRKISMQKEYGLASDIFKVQERVPVVTQVLQLWFQRTQTIKGKAPRIPHLVISASPGKPFCFLNHFPFET